MFDVDAQAMTPEMDITRILLKKAKVLVVEDDTHLRSSIREILELENYSVLTAQNGLDGLTVLKSDPDNPPDIIVSDIMMPHLDGFEFLEKVRGNEGWVTIPFIFLTARGEREDEHKGRELGADVYLTKPFDAENLLNAVNSTLDRHWAIQRRYSAETAAAIKEHKRKMITILNHEMRTPLTLVVAYADMLRSFDPENISEANASDMVTFLQGVNSGADRLRRLIENFVTVVELDNGEAKKNFDFRKGPIDDLSYVVYDAVRQVDFPEERPRKFEINIPKDLPAIISDVPTLSTAIRELLDNAAKFSSDDDTITLNAAVVDGMVEIAIRDEGRGIPLDEQDHIWERFYQIDRDKLEDQGSGSGLSIVDEIVKMHEGSRRIVSEPSKGSTFILRLPLAEQA